MCGCIGEVVIYIMIDKIIDHHTVCSHDLNDHVIVCHPWPSFIFLKPFPLKTTGQCKSKFKPSVLCALFYLITPLPLNGPTIYSSNVYILISKITYAEILLKHISISFLFMENVQIKLILITKDNLLL
jgi:hypothetical protein